MALNLRLLKLKCYRQGESDADEVFIKYDGGRIWPAKSKYHKVSEGEVEVNLDIAGLKRNSNVQLELWDYDFLSPNDQLGTFNMLIDERGGPFTTDLSSTGGTRYSLEWEVS